MAARVDEYMAIALYGDEIRRPLEAAAKVYKGAFLSADPVTGYAQSLIAGEEFLGLSKENKDNTNGVAGDEEAMAEYPILEAPDLTLLATDIGVAIYAVNDNPADMTKVVGANTKVGFVYAVFPRQLVKLVPHEA